MEIFGVILIIILLAAAINYLWKNNNRRKNLLLLKKIQRFYDNLKEIVINDYDLKTCSRCHESLMNLRRISPTGQSVEYSCDNCNKVIFRKLLPGKDGNKAAELFDDIKLLMEKLDFSVDKDLSKIDIDVKFGVSKSIINVERSKSRNSIPEQVRHEVWRRDQGKCVICGSQEKLEFDHIIPLSKGGANTVRNIQLLCESCNRGKSDKI